MPLPSTPVPAPAASSVARPVERPESANPVEAKPQAPFWVYFSPTSVELFDLSGAPEALLQKLGLKPEKYWLPSLETLLAVPGVNGVRGDPSWTTSDLLQHGNSEAMTASGRRAHKMLSAWHEIAADFCPPGVQPGPILRKISVVWNGQLGVRYLTPWEELQPTAPGRPARIKVHRALMGCWIASLVQSGAIEAANEAIVQEHRDRYHKRVERHELETSLPAEVRESRVKKASKKAEATKAEVIHG